MSRTITAAADAVLSAAHAPYLVFVELDFDSGIVRLCNAAMSIAWNGYTWIGLGSVGRIDPIQESADLTANGMAFQLSGIDPAYLALALGETYQGRSAKLWLAPIGRRTLSGNTAQAGAAQSLTLANAEPAIDGTYNGRILQLADGREGRVGGYVGSTRVATLTSPWTQNLFARSEEVDDAYWSTKNSISVSANAAANPEGILAADLVVPAVANLAHYFATASGQFLDSTNYVASARMRAGGYNFFMLELKRRDSSFSHIWFNLATGQVGTSVGSGLTNTMTPLGGGWYLCKTAFNSLSGGAADTRAVFFTCNADNVSTFVGDGVSGIYHGGVQLRLASAADTYLKTTAAALDFPGAAAAYTILNERDIVADPAGPFVYRMDTMEIEAGSTATIVVRAESRLADWDRPRVRRYTDEDQQTLYSGDKFFEQVSTIQDVQILF